MLARLEYRERNRLPHTAGVNAPIRTEYGDARRTPRHFAAERDWAFRPHVVGQSRFSAVLQMKRKPRARGDFARAIREYRKFETGWRRKGDLNRRDSSFRGRSMV
jgi:hypothetical protein